MPPQFDGFITTCFVRNWPREKDFYLKAARLARELCEHLLARNAIRAIITHRVKQGDRLESKLEERAQRLGKTYETFDGIREDVVDLAGVRIALYFPKDAEKVAKILEDAFLVKKRVSFPEHKCISEAKEKDSATEHAKGVEYEQRFPGYLADHYRVKMKMESLVTMELREDLGKPDPMIEIQVASVLMHAWAEVHHDLAYKTLTKDLHPRKISAYWTQAMALYTPENFFYSSYKLL